MNNFDIAVLAIWASHKSSEEIKACTKAFADEYIAYRVTGNIPLAEALALSTVKQHVLLIDDYDAASYINDLIRY